MKAFLKQTLLMLVPLGAPSPAGTPTGKMNGPVFWKKRKKAFT
jgi:hypothetical protein